MNKKIDYAVRDKMIDKVLKKHRELDDICHEIFFTLMAYKKLRFNELLRALKKLGIKITQPTLSEHLPHLIEKELIERKEEGFQNVSYSLTEEIWSLLEVSQEDIEEWVKDLEKSGKPIPPRNFSTAFIIERIGVVSNLLSGKESNPHPFTPNILKASRPLVRNFLI